MMSDTTPTPVYRQPSLFSRVSFPAPLSANRLREVEADGWVLTATVRGPDGQPREYLFMRRGEDPTPSSP
jgi:hypothetical protein